jgi:hypothetical protein
MNSAESNFSLSSFFKISSNQRTQMEYGHLPHNLVKMELDLTALVNRTQNFE